MDLLNNSHINVLLLCGDSLEEIPHGSVLIVGVNKLDCCYFKHHLLIYSTVTVYSLRARESSENVQESHHTCCIDEHEAEMK